MGKTFVRGKEEYSLAEKKELRELVKKYKKEYDKEVKAISHFSMQKVSSRSNYPINHFSPPPSPRLLYFTQISNSLLVSTPTPHPHPFIRGLRV